MKKVIILTSMIVFTTLDAQANNVENIEEVFNQIMQDAKNLTPAPKEGTAPKTKEDKNSTQEETPSKKIK